MKNALTRAAIAATLTLALHCAAQAQSPDTTTTIKDDARTVGHAVAHSARAVGHAVANGAKTVGAQAKAGAGKVKQAVTGKADEPAAPKS